MDILELDQILSMLTEEEKINERNYPELEPYMGKIHDVLIFAEKLSLEIDNYNNEISPFINVLVTDINSYILKIRTMNEDIAGFINIPFPVLITMRNIQKYFGLMAYDYHNLFRENYKQTYDSIIDGRF